MSISDLANTFSWWAILFSLGLVFLPLTSLLFSNFFDRGYIFSKILGILAVSYIVWLPSSLKLFPFSVFSILAVLGVFLAINVIIAYKKKTTSLLLGTTKVIFFEELLFLTGLTFWAFVKTHEPSIHGLEKFMDFGFINAALRSDFMPPKDMWLTPFSINYYYFGHFVTALLAKISSIDPAVAYNLMLSSLFAFTLTGGFSVGANLYHLFLDQAKRTSSSRLYLYLAGLLSAFLAALGGNLHTIYAFFQAYSPPENPIPFWQLSPQFNFSSYWYPNATRFIPFTIHEFPIYSFVVSDLHGHVLNIPFVLLILVLLLRVFTNPKLYIIDYLLLGLLIATSLMTNVLDGPIYLLVISLVLFVKNIKHLRFFPSILKTTISTGIITILAVLFSLPFWIAFKPFASGIGVLCTPQFLTNLGKLGPLLFEANHCAKSPLWMLMILWGFFYFVTIGFIVYILANKNFQQFLSSLYKKGQTTFHYPLSSVDLLAITLVFAATILILIPEFFYAKDIYPTHYRANTVFKFGYQAFIILAAVSGYMITRLFTHTKKSLLYLIFVILLFALVAIYPYFAINSYFNGLKNYSGLNGLTYLQSSYPNDYQAILWIRENIPGQPVILEAQGDSYTDYARVSANTGLPTAIGWPVHEWLWRGSYDEAGRRIPEVAALYESSDLAETKSLLQKYDVSLVFIGALEREKYPNLNEEKFNQLGKVIFQSGETRIYQINHIQL